MLVITVARKPCQASSVAENILEHGCGGLHLDAARVESGRFPANVILDEVGAASVDEQRPVAGAFAPVPRGKRDHTVYGKYEFFGDDGASFRGDSGGASRFFKVVKAR